ncbi:FAD binding domain-containing protein [Nannizzia gypsea CBS 118893]|uniref:FAD binding domain-containing protein n=1 Tax=Arthroderma gypseum (strain ATCC MYA-4604 / CBS 118893) TaxID=535722 RepID=E4V2V0_ARTGP|nr:FAD binding domain-containing protein [Nannizzia gypsea CBS 118893]EFR04324.1 FAD binding domain-containing protein [Nannizzia gypsea CBS 118893]
MIAAIPETLASKGSNMPFKVIIVGAGVAGLCLAHCLEKANIDYLVLDKGVVAPPFGTTITMQPHGCRILHQLGLLDQVLDNCSTMGRGYYRTSDGKCFLENDFFPIVKKYAGYDTRTLSRSLFLRILYDNLPDPSKILERHRVVNIIEENSIVRAILSDGTEYVGDLVVGTDGVHSKVRELMWDQANQAIPHFISTSEKRSMVTTYGAIVAQCPPMPGLGPTDMHSISNDKMSFLLLCQPDFISYILHYKLPENQQCRWPSRAKFTEADMEALAAKFADYPICESVVFGELWRTRTKAQMISLEEGVLNHWFFGRTVLAGDAIHKVTPNSALGGCTAMEDVVCISNALHAALNLHPNKKPSDVEISAALKFYQDSRLSRVKAIVKVASDLTRLQACDGWAMYIRHRWITPLIGLDALAINIAKLASSAPKLDYVPFIERRGLLGWQDTPKTVIARARMDKERPWYHGFLTHDMLTVLGFLFTLVSTLLLFIVKAASSRWLPLFGVAAN